MNQTDMRGALGSIRAALKSRPDGAITGSQVHSLIQSVAPELNVREVVGIPTGPGALTKFIQDHLSDSLQRIGNHGGDVLYGIVGHQQPAHGLQDTSSIWRTFVSPRSQFKIAYDREEKRLKLVDDEQLQEDGLVELPKASLDEHDELRQEFVDQLEPAQAESVNETVRPDTDFTTWIATLRTEFPSIYRAWGTFRKRRLLDLFVDRASAAGLEGDDHQNLLQQIKASQFAAYDTAKQLKFQGEIRPDPKRSQSTRYEKPRSEVEEARALVHLAVDLMAHDDLRAIKLPLGVVLDAIHNRD